MMLSIQIAKIIHYTVATLGILKSDTISSYRQLLISSFDVHESKLTLLNIPKLSFSSSRSTTYLSNLPERHSPSQHPINSSRECHNVGLKLFCFEQFESRASPMASGVWLPIGASVGRNGCRVRGSC